jgi:hypothetical protein
LSGFQTREEEYNKKILKIQEEYKSLAKESERKYVALQEEKNNLVKKTSQVSVSSSSSADLNRIKVL